MNNPFDYTPSKECDEAYRKLVNTLDSLRQNGNRADIELLRALDEGKMLGVLIARDSAGERHTLYAFSGQVGKLGFKYREFVDSPFDYLEPEGYFKIHERDISNQNRLIADFETNVISKLRHEYDRLSFELAEEVNTYKENCKLSKQARDANRKSGNLDDAALAALIRQSQFEKAELHRMKRRMYDTLAPLEAKLSEAVSHLQQLKQKRRNDSEALQNWLFNNFTLLNAKGESKSLVEIFAGTSLKIPPSGAGECCAPKLLQTAYLHGWVPISIAEYWYGKPKDGELRIDGQHYPACRGKCMPVLSWMLKGLNIDPPLCFTSQNANDKAPEILFENDWFCVVNKPSGMLSVPGKGDAISVEEWLTEKYGGTRDVKLAHRLDQATSGLLIATFSHLAHKTMQTLFASRRISKTYVAELEGDYRALNIAPQGRIELPLSADWLDRPRQRVDLSNGKPAITDYEFIEVKDGMSRIIFHPVTGRTHQLRVHSASELGLGMPIAGDRLYGLKSDNTPTRLKLHACKIEFTFPIEGKLYCFESPTPF